MVIFAKNSKTEIVAEIENTIPRDVIKEKQILNCYLGKINITKNSKKKNCFQDLNEGINLNLGNPQVILRLDQNFVSL